MGFALKYHRSEDRMTIGFVLPTGENPTCWVTRRQWLFLILRLSRPEDLPRQVLGKRSSSEEVKSDEDSQTSSGTLADATSQDWVSDDSPDVTKSDETVFQKPTDPEAPIMVEKIGVIKVDKGVCISFLLVEPDQNSSARLVNSRVNLTLKPQECDAFEKMLRSKSQQAGWDLEAGLKRLRASLRRQQAKSKPLVH